MVRVYTRTYRHSRNGKNFNPYISYSQESLEKAIAEIRSGATTLSQAAITYNIPKSTLSRKRRGLNKSQEKAGHPTLFTLAEEKSFLAVIKIISDWGFPFDSLDLRVFAQKYLNKMGKTVRSLKNNMPGVDWAKNFLVCHKNEISNRFAANISTDRAKLTAEVLENFFENYEQTVEGVSPDCIINYDETNLTDDPGNKKYIYKRGTKYPERVINSSKSAISLMFCGTADGTMLPVYVVYKAEHIWDSWIEGGPDKTRYNRSRSGWFDGICFEDWFNTIIVPYARKKSGRIVIIGDNLSSHFSETVLNTCQKLNISFVCLPPKSTHILQPLDVAFYAPLKHYWRQILTEWKKREGRKHKTLIKATFPRLLNKLANKLMDQDVGAKNIKAGFEKCGLYPVNVERPKSRLPQNSNIPDEVKNATSEVIVDMLQEIRGVTDPTEVIKRRKRCEVAPGKSITANDIQKDQTNLNKGQSKRKKSSREESNIIAEKSDSSMIGFVEEDLDNVPDNVSEMSEIIDLTAMTHFISEPGPSTSTIKTKNKKEVTKRQATLNIREKKPSKTGLNRTYIDKDADALRRVRELSIKSAYLAKKRRRAISRSNDSTTSVSDTMSEYNDSDIIDAITDTDDDLHAVPPDKTVLPEETYVLKKNKGKGKMTVPKEIQSLVIDRISTENEDKENLCINIGNSMIVQSMTGNEDSSSIKESVTDCITLVSAQATTKPVKVVNTCYITAQDDVNVRKSGSVEKVPNDDNENFNNRSLPIPIDENIEQNQINVFTTYDINDKVLVRYYKRKSWQYYIGFIENIELDNYTINFLSTVKKPDLKFIIKRRIDRDVVPAISIVKKIELVQNDERPQEFNLADESDGVYF